MHFEQLYKKKEHTWMVMGHDPQGRESVIDTNQYLVQNNGHGLLVDPGGVENFSTVASEFSKHIELANIDAIFASHQDPDVISSLSLWIKANPNLVVYVPHIWVSFITHYGVKLENIRPIPDEGGVITLGDRDLEAVPAHYLHSSGNLSLYDPQAKIFFSGDIGAALLPKDHGELFVTDFTNHIQYMEYFHRRWMPSNEAKSRWIAEVRKRDVEMLCPQHGAIFTGENIERFLSWFENLDVGIAWKSMA